MSKTPLVMSDADRAWAQDRDAKVETFDGAISTAFESRGLEYALAAILDCHTRIVARHVPSPRVRRVRAGYRDRSLRASLAHRTERR